MAVQDCWIVPIDREPTRQVRPFAFHSTSVRFFDAGNLISTDEAPWLRRRFTGFGDDRVVRLGEFSDPKGRQWRLEETHDRLQHP